jgi:hypothetical protein
VEAAAAVAAAPAAGPRHGGGAGSTHWQRQWRAPRSSPGDAAAVAHNERAHAAGAMSLPVTLLPMDIKTFLLTLSE